ncbi:NAD(P)-dependent oxidoreductase [Curtobacterium citreum]|uniref:NAD-dependent epimerase/dehydratase family protein n=1 Tax=Curtobacterium citreum TaxID=2036 RepID=A0ABT2HKE6_9MICO|nr:MULTISPECIES: NAD-dependent epimerase/dehydratase family protein [Curtobacterium]MCS6523711.1 NAD-dependent epimerase/dehydratase family protein [Curtobacterium citreum]RDH95462.1 nucleoside-diphosphate-sugar epimerase [Curtobacterium sp. AG1037]TQJ26496.1 nucleoside-diphosphate-sugar epimerase [Curtobacterium citreum]GGL87789.1 NAD(P)-dependent oxidoreductase [Curtobacterium citreum]
MQHTKTAVIAGCGDLGTEAGLRFADQGYTVVGLRRRAERIPAPITGRSVDLRREAPTIDADTAVVVVAFAAGSRDVDEYRATYVDGLRNVLDGVEASGASPRVVVVSSTAVYDESDGGEVSEETPARAGTPTAGVLLEAEELLRARRQDAVLVRLSGIYGPGRERLVDQVRDGSARLAPVAGGSPHTNRIHRDDAAAALVHLAAVPDPAPTYLGTDDEPVRLDDVLVFLAGELGVPEPPRAEASGRQAGGDKRLSNALLRSTGWEPRYPTFREGYRAVLAGEGVRHP